MMRWSQAFCLIAICLFGRLVTAEENSGQRPVLNENIDVHWIGDNDRFAWYESERHHAPSEIVAIEMATGRRLDPSEFPDEVPRPTTDDPDQLDELEALNLVDRSDRGTRSTDLHFVNETEKDVQLFWVDSAAKHQAYGVIAPGETRKQHTFVGHVWVLKDRNGKTLAATSSTRERPQRFTLTSQTKVPEKRSLDRRQAKADEPADSPTALIRDHNVWLRYPDVEQPAALTFDGTAGNGYDGQFWWSPDRSHVAVFRVARVPRRQVTLVDSSPDDSLQPKLLQFDYVKPGDDLDRPRLCVLNIETKSMLVVDDSFAPNPFAIGDVSWRGDSRAIRFVDNERGHQRLSVVEMSVPAGETRRIVDERAKTFIDYAGKYYVRFLDDTGELIWMSERDGWNHLYRIDQATGETISQITRGPWVVREVVELDEATRTMLVAVGGYEPSEDPYHLHLLRVSIDDGSTTHLTPGDGDHAWKFSPTKRYLVDRRSRVDMPPSTVIRSLQSGAVIASLESADASELLHSGWSLPQRFVAKGRDGETDIYGIVIRPKEFDKDKTYPVLEYIYAGPHAAHVPKSFLRLRDLHRAGDGIGSDQFIVVQMDGMGTSHRSKAFHDVCWKNLGDAGFPDRIAWMKAAQAEIPQMDLSRVGIWGGSAGGQNALRALIAHGDFYKAAFADCGCHDNRMDKIWWNELWMGWPVGPHYAEQSNVINADRITGKLMLAVGELDTNVDPASTLQVVDALIKADKDFELLLFPGAGHGAGGSSYGTRRRIDFFIRALHER